MLYSKETGSPGGDEYSSMQERLQEKKEPSLGERNPLLFPPNLQNKETLEALEIVTTRKIEKYGGVKPIHTEKVTIPASPHAVDRLIVRFELDNLSEEQLILLEELTKHAYGASARCRKDPNGEPIRPSLYPKIEPKKQKGGLGNKSRESTGSRLGWYLGADPGPLSTIHCGILVYKEFQDSGMASYLKAKDPDEWFLKRQLVNPMGEPVKTKYLVEVREGNKYQTDLVELITQVSSILGKTELLDHRKLLYEIYNDLNRLGLKKAGKDNVYGLDEVIKKIERVLILPLANLDLSDGIEFKPGSVLLIGVPGTGKTLVAEYLLQQETGVFILPIDPMHLAEELARPSGSKVILPRISQVFKDTNIPVVLHIDDVENIAKPDMDINSSLLNLMAGVRQSGFFVIASTNHPEKLNEQLLQPERLAEIIHLDLPNEEMRLGILDVHATRISKETNKPLFKTEEERKLIIAAIAKLTPGLTSRFLAEICTQAKSFFLERVAKEKGIKTGLTEEDLKEFFFEQEDWQRAIADVMTKYDKGATVKRDEELRKFVRHYSERYGFNTNPNGHPKIDLGATITLLQKEGSGQQSS